MQTYKFYFKKTATKSLPLVGSRLLHAATDFINMIIIAKLGLDAVAAGSLIAITSATILLVAWATLFSVAVVVGQAYGARQYAAIGQILKSGCLLALIIGTIAGVMMHQVNHILCLFHQPQNLIALAMPYFHTLAWGLIPSVICVCFNEFAIGILKTRLVIIWRLITTPITLGLSYCLVLGKFGLPKMGIAGAALGYTITYWGLAIALLIYFSNAKKYREYCLFKAPCSLAYIKQLFAIGWPISVQLGAIMAAYTMLTYMMGWFGKTALAANQITAQCATIVAMIPYGISQAAVALVAQASGQTKNLIKIAGLSSIWLSGMLVTIFSLVYWIAPKLPISIYLSSHNANNINAISLAILFLYINGISQIFDALGVTTLGALRGLSDTKIPMLINIIASWLVSIPIGYILAFKLGVGAIGLNMGFVLGSALNAFLLMNRFKKYCII